MATKRVDNLFCLIACEYVWTIRVVLLGLTASVEISVVSVTHNYE